MTYGGGGGGLVDVFQIEKRMVHIFQIEKRMVTVKYNFEQWYVVARRCALNRGSRKNWGLSIRWNYVRRGNPKIFSK